MVSVRDTLREGFVHFGALDRLYVKAGWYPHRTPPNTWKGTPRQLAGALGLSVDAVLEEFGFASVLGVENDLELDISLPPKRETDDLRQKPVAPWRNELARAISPETYHDLKRR